MPYTACEAVATTISKVRTKEDDPSCNYNPRATQVLSRNPQYNVQALIDINDIIDEIIKSGSPAPVQAIPTENPAPTTLETVVGPAPTVPNGPEQPEETKQPDPPPKRPEGEWIIKVTQRMNGDFSSVE
jgi:hypothetical protein